MHDDIDLQKLAETERIGKAIAAGELELVPDDGAPVPDLPPPDAPVNVIRPIRLPYDLDVQVRRLAAERGATISAMLRDLIASGLEVTTGVAPDPVTELRRSLDVAQRAAALLYADQHRDAA